MIVLSKLTRNDVPRMMAWGKHNDPRFFHYNFDITTENGFEFWYKSKRQLFTKRIYKVENEDGLLVGFITIKHIQWMIREAEMGIVFDPKLLSKGYGTAGIKAMLTEFFEEMNMNCLILKVARFNERAFHTYLKSGFEVYKTKMEPFEFQQINKVLKSNFDYFDDFDGVLYTTYDYMKITKETYKSIKSK